METNHLIKGHQGDFIFAQIESLPAGAIRTENKPLAVGSGGHAHAVTGDVERYELGDRVFFDVKRAAALQHVDAAALTPETYKSEALLPEKDHHPHVLPAGVYEFWIQKQYNPYKKAMEAVQD